MGNVHTHTHSLPGAHAHTHTPIYMSPILIQILRQTDTLRNKIHHFYHLQCIYSGSQRRSFILMKSIPASDLSDVTQFPSLSQSQLLTSSGPLLLFCCVCFWGWTSIHTEKRIVFLSVCYLSQGSWCCYRIDNAHSWYPWKVKLSYCVSLCVCLYSIWVGTVYKVCVSEWVRDRRVTIPPYLDHYWSRTYVIRYV